MKTSHLLAFILLSLSFTFSCSEDSDNSPDPAPGQVTAVIDGQEWLSNITFTGGVLTNVIGNKTLAIGATEIVDSNQTPGILAISFIEEGGDTTSCIPTGDYSTNPLASLRVIAGYEIGNQFFALTGVAANFSATISSCDPQNRTVTGVFSGVLQEGTNGPTLTIENGKFNQVLFTE